MQIAIRYETPLIFWGEIAGRIPVLLLLRRDGRGRREALQPRDEPRHHRRRHVRVPRRPRRPGAICYPFAYPPRKELMRIKCRSVCLGSYIKWDTKKHVEIIKRELGWKGQEVEGIPPEYDYEKIECMFQGVRDYCKFIKRGVRPHQPSRQHRHPQQADDPRGGLRRWCRNTTASGRPSLDLFLEYLQISEEEFCDIVQQARGEPARVLADPGSSAASRCPTWRSGIGPCLPNPPGALDRAGGRQGQDATYDRDRRLRHGERPVGPQRPRVPRRGRGGDRRSRAIWTPRSA